MTNNKRNEKERKLIADIKSKISANKLNITKADKGKTIVICTQEECPSKVNNFIQDNKFTVINNNSTYHYQNTIKQTEKQSNIIIQQETIPRYTNMNLASPSLHATIQLHKPNNQSDQ
jgi:hypothetical protein